MRSRKIIEASLKDVLVPSGRGDIGLQIELLLDVRELLTTLVDFENIDRQENAVRRARQLSQVERVRRTDGEA